MEQESKINIPQEAFDWYDEYAHGLIDRRTFLTRIGQLTSIGITASMISSALLPNYALAEQVNFNDSAIKASYPEFASPKGYGKVRGYLVEPASNTNKPGAVLVVHENRGLNPYIEDVARRLAKAGYTALAPDALFSVGGYPGNDDEGRELQSSLEQNKIEQDFIAAAQWLKTHPANNGKLGVVGFCFGGYITNMIAATLPEAVNAAVPFYGTPAAEPLVAKVRGPLLVQLAAEDQRVNGTWPSYETSLKTNKADYQVHVYPATQHGFHNDSTARYNQAAAELAWNRTLAFFAKHLQS